MNRKNDSNFGGQIGPKPDRWVVQEGHGRTAICLETRFQGRDLVVRITGGRAHAGAVAVFGAPFDSKGEPKGEDPVSTVILPGHQEGPLAARCAETLGRATGRSCVVIAGIHQDGATPREIAAIVKNVETAVSRMAGLLDKSVDESVNGSPSIAPADLPAIEAIMVDWARQGAEIALRYWRNTGALQFKTGQEAVTEADRQIELMVRERIRETFPGDGIVGEEFGADERPGGGGDSGRVWQIDPIDGTLNFALGLPGFCISLALVENGSILAGCVHVPTTGDSFTASAGRGARLNGQAMTVSDRGSLSRAIISTQFKKDDRYIQDCGLLQALHKGTYRLRRTGAIALELAWVAAGSYDALLANFRKGIHPYDVAAGLLLVQEAGGRFSDHEGRPYELGGPDLIVSNGLVHQEIIDLIEGADR